MDVVVASGIWIEGVLKGSERDFAISGSYFGVRVYTVSGEAICGIRAFGGLGLRKFRDSRMSGLEPKPLTD